MKSLRQISLLAIGAALLTSSVSSAASAAIKVLPARPIVIASLSGNSDDEISAVLSTSNSLIITGTVVGSSGDWVTSAPLGGSDGFIASVAFSGTHNWDLRLGTSGDEIASALIRDKSGNFWVIGSSAKQPVPIDSPSPSPSTTPSPVLNPDGVVVDPTTAPSNPFNQLMVWKVSRTGSLLATYSWSAPGTIFPTSVSLKDALFSASGEVASGGSIKKFTILFDDSGNFSQLIVAKIDQPVATSALVLPAGQNHWRIFSSNAAIAGIPSWKPKRTFPVAILYSKAGKILQARYFTVTPRFSFWQAGIGLISLGEQGNGFGMTIVNPLAG